MNKGNGIIIGVVAAIVCCSVGVGLAVYFCKKPTFVAVSDFFWKKEGDSNYGNMTFDLETGKDANMLLKVKVVSDTDRQQEIGAKLIIPYVKDVISYYKKGQPITPVVDELNNITTYNFVVLASKNPVDTELYFKFKPIAALDVTMILEFDEQVHRSFDKQMTISFVDANKEDTKKE